MALLPFPHKLVVQYFHLQEGACVAQDPAHSKKRGRVTCWGDCSVGRGLSGQGIVDLGSGRDGGPGKR